MQRSGEVEAIKVHHLRPGCHEEVVGQSHRPLRGDADVEHGPGYIAYRKRDDGSQVIRTKAVCSAAPRPQHRWHLASAILLFYIDTNHSSPDTYQEAVPEILLPSGEIVPM